MKKYSFEIKKHPVVVLPVKRPQTDEEVLKSAKEVYERHKAVILALAKR
ncbi:hypothetical protein NFK14_05190 [Escherichia coli]|jgi:hypothetical protein|nr:hypothetical protein [Escherichia coli]EEZ9794165.1 hypothetical protein [Escherichia coli O91]EEZ0891575.1 hypothetical protein [Escherichia coli]EFH1088185.1 hypothetical protein [Escherichia coli]EFI6118703.1 hypothetical protein [Escherichia coli]EFL5509008.1 hypothetical protein [Escherichia coli]